jgi:hypothetical protein
MDDADNRDASLDREESKLDAGAQGRWEDGNDDQADESGE